MNCESPAHLQSFTDLERQHNIPPDKYCGLTPEVISRVRADAWSRMKSAGGCDGHETAREQLLTLHH
jgi:hypothetical protein